MTSTTPTFIARRRTQRRRAGLLLEFVMLLPLTLLLFMLLVDGARLLLVSGAVSDASYRAARAGAVVGGGSYGDVSEVAFHQALDEIPGAHLAEDPDMDVVRGGQCTYSAQYVEVEATYSVRIITPGFGAAFGMMTDNTVDDGRLQLTSKAVARCEVAVP